MNKYCNIHDGERLFIIGTGPSLQQTPLEHLTNEYTMSMNKINLIYDKTPWRPTYYLFSDPGWYFHNNMPIDETRLKHARRNIESGMECIIHEYASEYFGNQDNITYFNEYKDLDINEKPSDAIESGDITEVWSQDVDERIYGWVSSIIPASQIAAYMGFDKIYFVGCDLYESQDDRVFKSAGSVSDHEFSSDSFIKRVRNFLMDNSNMVRTGINGLYFKLSKNIDVIGSDPNHFSDDYNPTIKLDAEERNEELKTCHRVINIASDTYDFEVYNATIGGHLEVYERVNIYNLLNIQDDSAYQ
jgi:hypothetical protein